MNTSILIKIAPLSVYIVLAASAADLKLNVDLDAELRYGL